MKSYPWAAHRSGPADSGAFLHGAICCCAVRAFENSDMTRVNEIDGTLEQRACRTTTDK
jgi:hypothetical protein